MGEGMGEGGETDRRQERRQQLLDAAIAAIGRHGPQVSMQQMAAEAGVTKPILYRHFGDKNGLIVALTLRYLADLRQAISGVEVRDLRELTRVQLDLGLQFLERRPGLFEYIQQQHGFEVAPPESGDSHNGPLTQFIEQVLASRGLPTDAAGPYASAIGGVLGSSVLWWLRSRSITRERFVDLIVGLLWDGLEKQVGLEIPSGVPKRGPAV